MIIRIKFDQNYAEIGEKGKSEPKGYPQIKRPCDYNVDLLQL